MLPSPCHSGLPRVTCGQVGQSTTPTCDNHHLWTPSSQPHMPTAMPCYTCTAVDHERMKTHFGNAKQTQNLSLFTVMVAANAYLCTRTLQRAADQVRSAAGEWLALGSGQAAAPSHHPAAQEGCSTPLQPWTAPAQATQGTHQQQPPLSHAGSVPDPQVNGKVWPYPQPPPGGQQRSVPPQTPALQHPLWR